MVELRNKSILILSPQAWGRMFISKHHYAIELAKRDNKVYFLNPPLQDGKRQHKSIDITAIDGHPNLFVVNHQLFFPYLLKFHAMPIFHALMRFHINRLLEVIPDTIDIVWSFDLGNLYPLKFFGSKPLKIFHPVDEPLHQHAISAAIGANVIFSVTQEIIDKYKKIKIPSYFINHGVAEEFILSFDKDYSVGNPIRIGISGNLLRPDIDRNVLLKIITNNTDCIFEFWGSYKMNDSNIGGGEDEDTGHFIETLKAQSNVVLHGVVDSLTLANEFKRIDLFLICYDVNKDQSKGTNYHKVMEYLATGKVVVSNNISAYKNLPDFVQMVSSRVDNDELPNLFNMVASTLSDYNSSDLRTRRYRYAIENRYCNQVNRIQDLVNE